MGLGDLPIESPTKDDADAVDIKAVRRLAAEQLPAGYVKPVAVERQKQITRTIQWYIAYRENNCAKAYSRKESQKRTAEGLDGRKPAVQTIQKKVQTLYENRTGKRVSPQEYFQADLEDIRQQYVSIVEQC